MSFSHPNYQRLNSGQEISTTGEILTYAATTYPDKIGLICGERCFSYADPDRAANRFAHYIRENLKDRDGPVAIMGKNSAEYAVTHFGIARSGRYSVNLHTRATADDLTYTINLTRPALIVADSGCGGLIDAVQEQFANPPHRVEIPDGATDTSSSFWQRFSHQPDTPPEIKIDPNEAGTIVFTGGTTGKPKAVLASHRARTISAMAAVEDFQISADKIGGFSVPFTHAAGLFSWFQPAVLAGCSGVIIPKWDAELYYEFDRTTSD